MTTGRSGVDWDSAFPPEVLRQYAVLADGERGVLVGPRGELGWMCAPRWDSDAVFSSLIGGGGGYAVTPADTPFVWGGLYEEGTLIWCSRWVTRHQVIQCREALAYPGDPHTAVLLRRVEAVDGQARVRVVLDPQAGFGAHGLTDLHRTGEVWTARSGPLHLRWSGAGGSVSRAGGCLQAELDVPGGEHRELVLEISDEPLPAEPVDPERAWAATRSAWARAVPEITGTLADRDARHAYAVMRGLTTKGGGMVAAATMSLPERAESGRNYDYRYAWIRDQSFAGQAVAAVGPHPLLDDAVSFIGARLLDDGPDLMPAYTVAGGRVPDEQSLDLGGYPGGSDKVGNWVNRQFQLDAFGEALLLFAAAARHDRLDREGWRAVEAAVAAIKARGQDPGAGIWELDDKRWAHSRLICVAGLRAVAAHAPARQGTAWTSLADDLLATTTDCLHPSGRWQRAPDDDRLDGALLLPAIRGAVPPDDPRSVTTLEAAIDELGDEHFMYRFRHDGEPLGRAEGAFLLCGFLTALSLHQQGREREAARWFDTARTACGPPGLFSEEFDITQRQLRGNLPQAFVHALLLESAQRLSRPWESAR